jgi:hypothetical protein
MSEQGSGKKMNPKYITWFETLLDVVLATMAEWMMLLIPVPQVVRVKESVMPVQAREQRYGCTWPGNRVPARLGVCRRANEIADCSLPTGVRI